MGFINCWDPRDYVFNWIPSFRSCYRKHSVKRRVCCQLQKRESVAENLCSRIQWQLPWQIRRPKSPITTTINGLKNGVNVMESMLLFSGNDSFCFFQPKGWECIRNVQSTEFMSSQLLIGIIDTTMFNVKMSLLSPTAWRLRFIAPEVVCLLFLVNTACFN